MTRSRASSTSPWLAASISITSSARPSRMETQAPQASHGSPSAPRAVQLMALARMRAVDVLPVPRGPTNRYAWASRSPVTARRSVVKIGSWPTSSPKRCARKRRYRARLFVVGRSSGTVSIGWAAGMTRPTVHRLGGERGRAPGVVQHQLAFTQASGSSQVVPRHPKAIAYRCFLPDLTGFTDLRCAGPDSQRRMRWWWANDAALDREFSSAIAVCGYRAPLVPRLARPAGMVGQGAGSVNRDRSREVAEREGFEPSTVGPERHSRGRPKALKPPPPGGGSEGGEGWVPTQRNVTPTTVFQGGHLHPPGHPPRRRRG